MRLLCFLLIHAKDVIKGDMQGELDLDDLIRVQVPLSDLDFC